MTKYSSYNTWMWWWPGLENSPTVTHACRKRWLKWVPSAWRYSWDTLSPGVWSSRLGVERWNPKQGRPEPELGCRALWWWWINNIQMQYVIVLFSYNRKHILLPTDIWFYNLKYSSITKFHGTLQCRGSQVGNPCFKGLNAFLLVCPSPMPVSRGLLIIIILYK
jgi:hypothetical protein